MTRVLSIVLAVPVRIYGGTIADQPKEPLRHIVSITVCLPRPMSIRIATRPSRTM